MVIDSDAHINESLDELAERTRRAVPQPGAAAAEGHARPDADPDGGPAVSGPAAAPAPQPQGPGQGPRRDPPRRRRPSGPARRPGHRRHRRAGRVRQPRAGAERRSATPSSPSPSPVPSTTTTPSSATPRRSGWRRWRRCPRRTCRRRSRSCAERSRSWATSAARCRRRSPGGSSTTRPRPAVRRGGPPRRRRSRCTGATGRTCRRPGTERFDTHFMVHAIGHPFEQMIAMAAIAVRRRARRPPGAAGRLPRGRVRVGAVLGRAAGGALRAPLGGDAPDGPVAARVPVATGAASSPPSPTSGSCPEAIEAIGAECVMYASDYPHTDSKFPYSVKAVRERGRPQRGRRRSGCSAPNALRYYGPRLERRDRLTSIRVLGDHLWCSQHSGGLQHSDG